jgi:hypothetical protein
MIDHPLKHLIIGDNSDHRKAVGFGICRHYAVPARIVASCERQLIQR